MPGPEVIRQVRAEPERAGDSRASLDVPRGARD